MANELYFIVFNEATSPFMYNLKKYNYCQNPQKAARLPPRRKVSSLYLEDI